jgi:hypothetical protein
MPVSRARSHAGAMATYELSTTFGTPVLHDLAVEIYTDSHVIRGTVPTRQRRLSDVLNEAENDFIIVSDAEMTEFGSKANAARAEFAQVNLATVLFAVSDLVVEPLPEMRMQKESERALIVVPPFRIIGSIHVLPDRGLRQALSELTGRFIPVTGAEYWSDTLGVVRTRASMIAFNRQRAHVLASHDEADSWAGSPLQDH